MHTRLLVHPSSAKNIHKLLGLCYIQAGANAPPDLILNGLNIWKSLTWQSSHDHKLLPHYHAALEKAIFIHKKGRKRKKSWSRKRNSKKVIKWWSAGSPPWCYKEPQASGSSSNSDLAPNFSPQSSPARRLGGQKRHCSNTRYSFQARLEARQAPITTRLDRACYSAGTGRLLQRPVSQAAPPGRKGSQKQRPRCHCKTSVCWFSKRLTIQAACWHWARCPQSQRTISARDWTYTSPGPGQIWFHLQTTKVRSPLDCCPHRTLIITISLKNQDPPSTEHRPFTSSKTRNTHWMPVK